MRGIGAAPPWPGINGDAGLSGGLLYSPSCSNYSLIDCRYRPDHGRRCSHEYRDWARFNVATGGGVERGGGGASDCFLQKIKANS